MKLYKEFKDKMKRSHYLNVKEVVRRLEEYSDKEYKEWLVAYYSEFKTVEKAIKRLGIEIKKDKFEIVENLEYYEFKEKLNKKISKNMYYKLQEKLTRIFYWSSGYSMGETIDIYIDGILFCSINNEEKYSGKYVGRETYGYEMVKLTFAEAKKVKMTDCGEVQIVNNRSIVTFESVGQKQYWEIVKKVKKV